MTGRRLVDGASVMARQAVRALWPGEWGEALARWFILALAGAFVGTAVALHPRLWAVVAAAVLARAYAAGRRAAVVDETAEETYEEYEADPVDVVAVVWNLIGQSKGVHLATVAQALTDAGSGEVWSTVDVRQLLDDAGVPVRHSVRATGMGVAVGVHRDDLPPLPSPTPSEAPCSGVAAQVTAATATATPAVEEIGGGAALIVTPSGPRRRQGVNGR
ncbi:hypothetical protein SRB5_39140 [Streptomyces sp. RB5]|uniref:Uncharacterized protein n=1 Tax=Streptomyces smaragdinus TaxID=2585196 RepID=A0A7K0CL81_9ACTN|nr:hypothetical protein [Streptomyces smaragdinus]MQY13762.1 hypothetical protein [Streptomyces smaragdinus]